MAALLVIAVVAALIFADRAKETARIQAQADATTISMPPRAGGLVRSTNPKVVALARKAVTDGRLKGVPNPQAAGYGKTASGLPSAVAWGAAAPIDDPQIWLTRTFALAGRHETKVVGVAAYPPGPLGGSMQCGELDKPAIGSLCGWADNGSVVLILVVGLKPDKAAPLVLRMRADIEHRR